MSSTGELRMPIVLEGVPHETIWGGRNLASLLGKALPEGARVGETWETAVESRVRSGPLAGETLGALVERFGADLIGWRSMELVGRRFPLLTKFIDAQQQLSVQVHPDDLYAATHEAGKLGKTECWYILATQPGATLVYGLARDATRDEVRQAIAEGRLEDLLQTVRARVGDAIFVPAGTVHAIGAGVVLYELQEYSDVTYRLYDYARVDATGHQRELHIDRALDVMATVATAGPRFAPIALPLDAGLTAHRALVACDYFVLEELHIVGRYSGVVDPSSCQILTILEGSLTVCSDAAQVPLHLGDTAVLPASLGSFAAESEGARVMRSIVPRQDEALVAAWRSAQPDATSR